MLIGYGRISTKEQKIDLQKDALTAASCEKSFFDVTSGAKSKRPELDKLKEQLRKGDTLIVWRLDRLGRSVKDLVEWVNWLESKGIGFKSLQENIDTTTPTGKLVFHVFASIAEFERNLIQERTRAGLEAARTRGRVGGRKKSLDEVKHKALKQLYEGKMHSISDLCKMFDISKQTLYSYVKN
jgi:DNA invertase Pin-like site-specific DNA recombinase